MPESAPVVGAPADVAVALTVSRAVPYGRAMDRATRCVLVTLIAILAAGCDDTSCEDSACGQGGSGSTTTGTTTSTGSKMTTSSSTTGGGTTSSTGGDKCAGGPLAAPIPNCAPAPLPTTGDPAQDCVDRINQLRFECQCLPPLARWTDAEMCTDSQAADDQASGQAHSHFPACGENAQNTCPDWPSEGQVVAGCLQSMWDEGPGDFNQGHGHYINMTNPAYSKVACGFSTGQNGVWSNQNFAP